MCGIGLFQLQENQRIGEKGRGKKSKGGEKKKRKLSDEKREKKYGKSGFPQSASRTIVRVAGVQSGNLWGR